MNKKILSGIIAALIVAGVGIYALSNKTNNNTSSEVNEAVTNIDNNNNSNSNSDSTSENKPTSNNNVSSNNETAKTLEEIDAAANAEIASDKDKAVKKLVDYYLGVDNNFTKNTTKVSLVTNSDKTITISKTNDDSNVYYTGKSELSDKVTDGVIITIENYNESEKVYTYSIKNFADVKSGNTSKTADTGSIPEKGAVTSNLKNK